MDIMCSMAMSCDIIKPIGRYKSLYSYNFVPSYADPLLSQ